MLKQLLCCLSVLFPLFVAGQDAGSDRSPDMPRFPTKIEALIAKGKKFIETSPDSLSGLSKQLYSLSVAQNNKHGQVYAEDFEAYGYWMAANYADAMQAALRALADAERWKINDRIPHIYGIIANLHKENTNYPMAFDDASKGLAVARQLKDTTSVIALLGLKAMFTHSYYSHKQRRKDDDNSLALEFEALKIAESNPKYEQMRIRFYDNIAQTYKERKQYKQALEFGYKGVYLANKYKQPRSLTYSYNWLGEAYYYMGERFKGINFLTDAIAISRQLKQPYREMELYETLYDCYESSGDYKEALAAYMRSEHMRDSLQVAKNERLISELQLKYEARVKDKEIAGLDELNVIKSRKINWILVGLVVFVLLLIIILYLNIVINKNNKTIQDKNRMLHHALDKIAYVQSHQIRKPLASILGLINVIKADGYHADKETLRLMEKAAGDLDTTIRDVIANTEIEPVAENTVL